MKQKTVFYFDEYDDDDVFDLELLRNLHRVKCMVGRYLFSGDNKNDIQKEKVKSFNKMVNGAEFENKDINNVLDIIEIIRDYQTGILCDMNESFNSLKKDSSGNKTQYPIITENGWVLLLQTFSENIQWLDSFKNEFERRYIR